MSYVYTSILDKNLWNNAFSYDIRTQKYLTIPSLIDGTIDDIKIWDDIVFEETDDGRLRSCRGLEHFIRLIDTSSGILKRPITVFDNHNHALYFWLEAMRDSIISPWCELIHIDEHSDLWDNAYILDREKALIDEAYAWEYTNHSCNVGNYIRPALDAGIIGSMIRIENGFELEKYIDYTPSENSILNIDLDFFAPEMCFINEAKKLSCIQNLLTKVKCVTIATSPFFIDQWLALDKLRLIFAKSDHSTTKKM